MAHILIIEDDPPSRLALRRMLERAGHQVSEAHEGRSGLELLQREAVQLALCDWMMPEMNGLELCQHAKADPRLRTIPIILITARCSLEDQAMAFAAGADDFLAKPVHQADLLARVHNGLRIHALMTELSQANARLHEVNETLLLHNRQLQELSLRDDLTDLPNRRAFQNTLPDLLNQLGDRQNPKAHYRHLALLLFDIDHFKTINDAHGHTTGDQVLQILARRLIPHIRANASLFRYAGDEFACLTPGIAPEHLGPYAETLRSAIAEQPFALNAPPYTLPVTLSIGIALTTSPHTAPDTLFQEADLALYAAKTTGRNRYAIAGQPPPPTP